MKHFSFFVVVWLLFVLVCAFSPLRAEEQPKVREILEKLEKQYENIDFDRSSMYYSSDRVREIERHITESVKAERQEEATEYLTELFKIMRELDDDKDVEAKRSMIRGISSIRRNHQLYEDSLSFTGKEIELYRVAKGDISFSQDPVYYEFCFNRNNQLKQEAAEIKDYNNKILSEAARAAYRLEDPVALAIVANTFAKIGDKEAAEQILDKCFDLFNSAYKGAKSRSDTSYMAYLIAVEVLEAKVDVRIFKRAVDLLQDCKNNDDPGDQTFSHNRNLAEKSAASGTVEEMEVIIPLITEKSEKDYLENRLKGRRAQEAYNLQIEQQKTTGTLSESKPRTRPRPVSEPQEIPFDNYAGEFQEMEGWRQVFTLLLKKPPTPEEAIKAVSTTPVGTNLLKKGETINQAMDRIGKQYAQSATTNETVLRIDTIWEKLGQELVKRGQLDDAILVANQIKHPAPKAGLLLAVAARKYDLATTPQEKAAADSVFAQLKKHQESYGNDTESGEGSLKYFRDEWYCAIVIRYAQRNRMADAVSVCEKIELPFEKAEAVYVIAMKYALMQQYEKAIQTALEIQDAVTGSYSHWTGGIACGMGPQYSKLNTLAQIIALANQSANQGSFDLLEYIDLLDNPRKRVDAILSHTMTVYDTGSAAFSSRNGTYSGIGMGGMMGDMIEDTRPILSESEQGRELLKRVFRETLAIQEDSLKEKTLIQLLPFLQSAKMSQEVFEAASLLDPKPKYTDPETNKPIPSVYSFNITTPQVVIKAAECLAQEKHGKESLVLTQKVLDATKTIQDTRQERYPFGEAEKRNQLICEVAKIQALAGFFEEAKQTLNDELAIIQNKENQTPYLNRIAETQRLIGDNEAAEKSHLESLRDIEKSRKPGFFLIFDRIEAFRRFCDNYLKLAKPQ